jgi:7-cyano-7-deazaguanine reductase
MIKHENPLGQATLYPSSYSPELLFPIERKSSRALLGILENLPFSGVDIWTGYELSWLNSKGKPVAAVGEFSFPCGSPFMVESKSFKLYLNSFNQTRFSSVDEVKQYLEKDLSGLVKEAVLVNLYSLEQSISNQSPLQNIEFVEGICLDEIDLEITQYHPAPELLIVDQTEIVSETVFSHLLKTNCPVTGQPDWASLVITYTGSKINHENLLAYIISFREHQDFHEHCVERIFCDIQTRCKPQTLTVYARYTRRGGLDINPYRSSEKNIEFNGKRLLRQ